MSTSNWPGSKKTKEPDLKKRYIKKIKKLQSLFQDDQSDYYKAEEKEKKQHKPRLLGKLLEIDPTCSRLESYLSMLWHYAADEKDREFPTEHLLKSIQTHLQALNNMRSDLIEFQKKPSLQTSHKDTNDELQDFIDELDNAIFQAKELEKIYLSKKKSFIAKAKGLFKSDPKEKKCWTPFPIESKKSQTFETEYLNTLENYRDLSSKLSLPGAKDFKTDLAEENWKNLTAEAKYITLQQHLDFFAAEKKKDDKNTDLTNAVTHLTSLLSFALQDVEANFDRCNKRLIEYIEDNVDYWKPSKPSAKTIKDEPVTKTIYKIWKELKKPGIPSVIYKKAQAKADSKKSKYAYSSVDEMAAKGIPRRYALPRALLDAGPGGDFSKLVHDLYVISKWVSYTDAASHKAAIEEAKQEDESKEKGRSLSRGSRSSD